MRLQLVREPPYFDARCVTCQQHILSGQKVADLDGPPFKAYYHDHVSCLPKGARIEKSDESSHR